MTAQVSYFPLIPSNVACAARIVYGKDNPYLTIGDKLETLLDDLDSSTLVDWKESPEEFIKLLLVTLFQFVEGLPDRQAVEAIHSRLDWQYALHLPLSFSRTQPIKLCQFRQYLMAYPNASAVLETAFRFFPVSRLPKQVNHRNTDGMVILGAVCRQTRLDWSTGLLLLALNALATCEPQWLRAHALPHWHAQYIKPGRILTPRAVEQQEVLARSIEADTRYLLQLIEKEPQSSPASIPEVQFLASVWKQHGTQSLCQIAGCKFCEKINTSNHWERKRDML